MDIDKLVKAYVNIRDKRSELEKEKKALKKNMDAIEIEIMKACDAQGVESFKTSYGTAYKNKKTFISVTNWEAAIDYIVANDLTHMLTRSVQKAAAIEYMDENNNTLPPGLEFGSVTEIGIRRK